MTFKKHFRSRQNNNNELNISVCHFGNLHFAASHFVDNLFISYIDLYIVYIFGISLYNNNLISSRNSHILNTSITNIGKSTTSSNSHVLQSLFCFWWGTTLCRYDYYLLLFINFDCINCTSTRFEFVNAHCKMCLFLSLSVKINDFFFLKRKPTVFL